MLKSKPAVDRLINEVGTPIFGYFDDAVAAINIDTFNYKNVMDKPASRWAKHFHYKQFQFVSIVTERYVIGAAIADIRYLASGFAYVYDHEDAKYRHFEWLKPKSVGYRTEPSPYNSSAFIKSGVNKFEIDIAQGQWIVKLELPFLQGIVKLEREQDSSPIALCNRTGYNGWTYTQKHNALSVDGELTIDGSNIELSSALASYDFSAGYMRRDTSWCWASASGKTAGDTVGFNLANGVNETGLNENAFWINGERHLLGPVVFEFDRSELNSEWRIYSYDGRVNLKYRPKDYRKEKLNFWLLRSNFRQFVGSFAGYIIDTHGQQHVIDEITGLTEDHYARW
ncbi:DUF2804 domain-containing protein [Veronia pacifica]|uniref:DUF2804 domain-containing protein n=1 Tax=Veronia pacifica TaxID=1080227 RepID=A0A1C3EMV8_9GAMM|nr:DUF2804 domain-containing protein [Veronia pacifica]ODA34576.1 hypothetical protein A8L45_05665 [Veronia pacifica]